MICTLHFNARHQRRFQPRNPGNSIGSFAHPRRPRPLPNRLRGIVAPALNLRFPSRCPLGPVRPILPTLHVSASGSSSNRTRCLACLDCSVTLSIQPSLPSGIFAPRDQSARPAERFRSLPRSHDRLPFSPRQLPACLLSANGSSIQVLHRSAWLADSVNLLEPHSACAISPRESKFIFNAVTIFQRFYFFCFQWIR